MVFSVTAPGEGALCRCAEELPFYKRGRNVFGTRLTHGSHTHRRQTSVALLGLRGARNAFTEGAAPRSAALSYEFLSVAGRSWLSLPCPSAAASFGDVLKERRQSPRGFRSGQREPL